MLSDEYSRLLHYIVETFDPPAAAVQSIGLKRESFSINTCFKLLEMPM